MSPPMVRLQRSTDRAGTQAASRRLPPPHCLPQPADLVLGVSEQHGPGLACDRRGLGRPAGALGTPQPQTGGADAVGDVVGVRRRVHAAASLASAYAARSAATIRRPIHSATVETTPFPHIR